MPTLSSVELVNDQETLYEQSVSNGTDALVASDVELAALLERYQGNVTAVARAVGMTREWTYARIAANPDLRLICHDARESLIDFAESALYQSVVKREPWAVAMVLKTIGKSRGYVEQRDVDIGQIITMLSAMMGLSEDEAQQARETTAQIIEAQKVGANQWK